jgi:hypothetical protein
VSCPTIPSRADLRVSLSFPDSLAACHYCPLLTVLRDPHHRADRIIMLAQHAALAGRKVPLSYTAVDTARERRVWAGSECRNEDGAGVGEAKQVLARAWPPKRLTYICGAVGGSDTLCSWIVESHDATSNRRLSGDHATHAMPSEGGWRLMSPGCELQDIVGDLTSRHYAKGDGENEVNERQVSRVRVRVAC